LCRLSCPFQESGHFGLVYRPGQLALVGHQMLNTSLAVCRSNRITGDDYTVYSSISQPRTLYSGLFARKVFSPTSC
jgi:hypothetical protein